MDCDWISIDFERKKMIRFQSSLIISCLSLRHYKFNEFDSQTFENFFDRRHHFSIPPVDPGGIDNE